VQQAPGPCTSTQHHNTQLVQAQAQHQTSPAPTSSTKATEEATGTSSARAPSVFEVESHSVSVDEARQPPTDSTGSSCNLRASRAHVHNPAGSVGAEGSVHPQRGAAVEVRHKRTFNTICSLPSALSNSSIVSTVGCVSGSGVPGNTKPVQCTAGDGHLHCALDKPSGLDTHEAVGRPVVPRRPESSSLLTTSLTRPTRESKGNGRKTSSADLGEFAALLNLSSSRGSREKKEKNQMGSSSRVRMARGGPED
jgi:hypothetical protein